MGLPAPWLIGLVLVCIALAAIPTRRLSDAGLRPAWLTAYLVLVTGLAIAVIAVRGPARFLVPFLVVLYVAPLVVAPETTARWLRRGRRPPRPVGSGPGRDVGSDSDHPSAADGEPGRGEPPPGGPPALPPG
jgi:uncharacterized membrane protein YhaH (DUF805 family)